MILDPTDQFIRHITAHCYVDGKTILEVGCGRGRITCDLARLAWKVVAIDPDEGALQAARSQVAADNVEFVRCGGEAMLFPESSFDLVIYSLSLHHLPVDWMQKSLEQAARLLRDGGKIIVIEPGGEGTLIEAEERFGVGCGNERAAKSAARKAVVSMAELNSSAPIRFRTLFHFADRDDFMSSLLPGHGTKPPEYLEAITDFLEGHREGERIALWADRVMFVIS
ncbi:MAG: class I SAM-dependent methyltransferase [Geobacter sp.]|nr:class I SAM-dependent methyltransferase [Geobacter sp.]